ncbi:ATP-binding protein, partial [Nonomuraea sp. MG754425]|uniref:AAA family ATPase n=1 Tax=Nonomuraea sp. MG754425 TaxID=2570319 RepID=UPI001F460291
MLYGRTAELAAIDEVISRARAGAGAALVLRGEAGVGKTALLEAAGARGDGMPVLRATGVEPESDLAFATLHRLLRPVTGLLDTLPGPQRAAVGGALGLTGAASGDRFLLGAGVLSLLAEAAAPDGLVCVVDDLPWVDRASADALLFAARRLGTERVAMLFGVRGDMPVKGVPSVTVDGLSEPAAAELLDADVATPARPGRDGIGPAVRRELVALTAGNPLALRETVRRLTPGQLAGREPLPDPLPGGTRLFGEQVAALTPTTRTVALLAALESDLDLVLRAAASLPPLHDTNLTSEHLTGEDFTSASLTSEDFTGEHLTGASLQGVGLQGMGLHGTDPQDTAPQDAGPQDAGLRSVGLHGVGAAEAGRVAVDELEAAGLASVTGSSVRFRHPLVRSAVYEAATPAARRRAHAVLAGPADGDRRAWHLAAATLGQDEAAATALAETAARARDRGGYGDAATALARAAELTPDPRARAVRLKDAAVSAWLGGRPGQAESLLADAREQAGRDARLEAEIAQLRGRFELNSGNAAEAVRILMAGDSLTMLADASEAASYAGDVA